jgi:acetylglutamate kinase
VKILVKVGGALLDEEATREPLARRIAGLAREAELVVVHGGGRQLTRYLAARGVQSRFLDGLRVTTPEVLEGVIHVFAGINQHFVAALTRAGIPAIGLTGMDGGLVQAEPMNAALGSVGRVTHADPALLQCLRRAGYLPVVACIAGDRAGSFYNVNADQMAAACAAAFEADRLMFLTDVEGVLDAQGHLLPQLTIAESEAMMAAGAITGGMLAKLRAAQDALRRGVREVRITAGSGTGGTLLLDC